ncbi:MAG: hypothetical protein U0768_08035 [Anaerolineae bacterium]
MPSLGLTPHATLPLPEAALAQPVPWLVKSWLCSIWGGKGVLVRRVNAPSPS